MTRPLLEVCVSSAESGWLAAENGADRLELCSVLQVGGVTPHPTLLKELRGTRLPLAVLVRCRPGDFVYSSHEQLRMIAQAEEFLELGADFVVVGALKAEEVGSQVGDQTLDLDFLDQFTKRFDPSRLVFHRAFDSLRDPFCALDALVSREWARVLSSGQQTTALEGAGRLKALSEKGGWQITILPGGGIRATNAADILKQTGLKQLHASCLAAPETTAPGFGSREMLDVTALRALRGAMDSSV